MLLNQIIPATFSKQHLQPNTLCNWKSAFTSLWRILAHSSLQNCSNSTTLESFWAWLTCLTFSLSHLNRVQVRTLTNPLQSFNFVFFKPCFWWSCFCTLDCSLAAEPNCAWTLALKQQGTRPSWSSLTVMSSLLNKAVLALWQISRRL